MKTIFRFVSNPHRDRAVTNFNLVIATVTGPGHAATLLADARDLAPPLDDFSPDEWCVAFAAVCLLNGLPARLLPSGSWEAYAEEDVELLVSLVAMDSGHVRVFVEEVRPHESEDGFRLVQVWNAPLAHVEDARRRASRPRLVA